MLTCCYCGGVASGRYVFLNRNEEVVDNPFCSIHSTAVFNQTRRGLETLHNTASLNREYYVLQRWSADENPPELPKDKQDLFSKGGLYIH